MMKLKYSGISIFVLLVALAIVVESHVVASAFAGDPTPSSKETPSASEKIQKFVKEMVGYSTGDFEEDLENFKAHTNNLTHDLDVDLQTNLKAMIVKFKKASALSEKYKVALPFKQTLQVMGKQLPKNFVKEGEELIIFATRVQRSVDAFESQVDREKFAGILGIDPKLLPVLGFPFTVESHDKVCTASAFERLVRESKKIPLGGSNPIEVMGASLMVMASVETESLIFSNSKSMLEAASLAPQDLKADVLVHYQEIANLPEVDRNRILSEFSNRIASSEKVFAHDKKLAEPCRKNIKTCARTYATAFPECLSRITSEGLERFRKN